MKLAIVGSGIAGMTCAHRLQGRHQLTIYEARDYVGGHTATVDVEAEGKVWAVDTGFIVFNSRTYPGFLALLEELEVPWRRSDMSFSARAEAENVEYNGTSLGQLFGQRRNILRPAFHRMVRDILRFYREGPELLQGNDPGPSLGEYLEAQRYSDEFRRWHMIPMGAAVWSTPPEDMLQFPARFLVQFFANHGFLQVKDRPDWLTIHGGSREYMKKLATPFAQDIRLSTPIAGLRRVAGGVQLLTQDGTCERYDRVILACHADQALGMLEDPTPLEREVLSAFCYQRNEVVLHSDASLMPQRKRCWASWNYHVHEEESAEAQANVTYWMNRLQGLEARTPFLVTLNHTERIDPDRVLRRFTYHHPLFTHSAVRAQERHAELNGSNLVYFAGAYWGYGFHEDGLRSADASVAHLEQDLARAELMTAGSPAS